MLFTTRQRLLTLALAGCFGTLLTAHHPATMAQAASPLVDIQLPAQPLASALANLSGQTGIQIFAPGDLVSGKTAPAISGRMSVPEALARLLDGSGLRAQPGTNGSFTVHPLPLDHTLPPIKVQARPLLEDVQGPVDGLVARRSATATKTDTPLIEVPQSISVIGRDELDARGAQSVMEALRYVPGVAVDSWGVETRGTEWVLMRGFDVSDTATLVDGLRLAQSTWVNVQTETYGLERIEVLRGPASVTYGQVEAGGTIHRISKRPDANAPRELVVQTGSYGRKQLAVDLGGALNDDGTVRWRLVGLGLDTENQMKFANGDRGSNQRQFIAPSLTWRPSAATSLTLMAEKQRNVIKGFSLYVDTPLHKDGILTGDPKYLRYTQDQSQIGYQLRHQFNDTWTLNQNVRYAESGVDNHFIFKSALSGSTVPRTARYADDNLHQLATDTNLQARFDHGRVQHTILLGLDWSEINTRFLQYQAPAGTTPALDLLNPVYGVPFPTPSNRTIDRESDTHLLGIYAQDQLKIDQRWVVTLGGRHDEVKSHSRSGTQFDRQRDHAFSGRAGLSYLAPRGVTPYISYAESFVPQTLKTAAGESFQPTRGTQWEIGLKVQPEGGDSLFTVALFDLTKTNAPTYDDQGDPQPTGEVRSRGLELEAKTRLARNLDAYAAYSYNDIEVTKSLDIDLGKVPMQVPRRLASAGIDYTFTGALQGFSTGAGVRYVGKRYDDMANTISSKSFTLVDAAIRYDQGPWRFALNVANLFDKDYVASRAYGGYYPGAERSFTLTARYRF